MSSLEPSHDHSWQVWLTIYTWLGVNYENYIHETPLGILGIWVSTYTTFFYSLE